MFRAVKKGILPAPETLKCVDCGHSAVHYEHRDYNRPLDVEPVCRSCNAKRGAAVPRGEMRERGLTILEEVIAQRAA